MKKENKPAPGKKKLNLMQESKGNSKISSTSKIKNTSATKKKRKDKGVRGSSLGKKPHSNGLDLFKSKKFFFLTEWLTKNKASPIKTLNTIKKIKFIKNDYVILLILNILIKEYF